MRALILCLCGAIAALGATVASAADRLPQIELAAGIHRIAAEVAASPPARAQGLMHRQSLAANAGMLFVFPETATHCFWMKNTLLPLAIAFLADDGSIVDVQEMAAGSEASHCPARPVRLALEMNAGWFARRGLGSGSRISGLGRLPEILTGR